MAVDLKRYAETATCEPPRTWERGAVPARVQEEGAAGQDAGVPAEGIRGHTAREDMTVVIVGHVDHGKSTIIGRLLADTGSLPEGKLEQVQERCRRSAKGFEYSFLLDALKDEQEQGITIDAARCHFRTAKRDYLIIDAPGHVEFLRNMVTGAARAQAALLVIDASEGVQENSTRHGYLLSMLGIKQVAVLINKMDLVGYHQGRYEALVAEYGAFLNSIGTRPAAFVPVSGREGDNIVRPSAAMPWYRGPSVLELLDGFVSEPVPVDKPLRMPVQGVYRFTAGGDRRRIVAGTIETGSLRVGDRVVFYPSGKESRVKTIEAFGEDPLPQRAEAGQATGFTLEEQIYVRRGEIACRVGEPAPSVGRRLLTTLFWLGKDPLVRDKTYWFKLGTAKVEARLVEVREVLDAASLRRTRKDQVERNDVAECLLELQRPVAFDEADVVAQTSRFVLVDEYEISGGGIVQGVVEEGDGHSSGYRGSANGFHPQPVRRNRGPVTREERARALGQRGLVLWFTGLSGSGKSTLSAALERALFQRGRAVYRLDGDALREGLCRDLGFTEADREENVRRIAEVAALFYDAGFIVLVACISPLARLRRLARERIGDDFVEIYVKASLETCVARDPKGLYQRALRGQLADFTGVSSPYEEPGAPDLVLDTERWGEEECLRRLLEAVEGRVTLG